MLSVVGRRAGAGLAALTSVRATTEQSGRTADEETPAKAGSSWKMYEIFVLLATAVCMSINWASSGIMLQNFIFRCPHAIDVHVYM